MMVFDEWYNGVHVAYIITSSYKMHDFSPWMDALNKNLLIVKAYWHPNVFIVDDARVETNCLRYTIMSSSILLHLWFFYTSNFFENMS